MPKVKWNNPKELILSKISISADNCWEWTGYVSKWGYGQIRFKRKSYRAHRLSYEAFIGAIPRGLEIDHLCRNRRCVNPKHLEAVTRFENVLRGNSPAAKNALKDSCLRGHKLSGDNSHVTLAGYRKCMECGRATARKNHAIRRDEINANRRKKYVRVSDRIDGGKG